MLPEEYVLVHARCCFAKQLLSFRYKILRATNCKTCYKLQTLSSWWMCVVLTNNKYLFCQEMLCARKTLTVISRSMRTIKLSHIGMLSCMQIHTFVLLLLHTCASSNRPAGNYQAHYQWRQLLYFCCSTIGARSGKYAQQLVDQGVPQVYNLRGSIIAWVSG